MKNIITFILNILMINNEDDNRVGLSQFKDRQSNFRSDRKFIPSKDVKLSDLLRRA